MILNSPYVSGSLTVTGNIIASGSITLSGSVASASYAASASNALAAQTASTTPNAVTTASISGPTISFSKGNASTFDLTVNNVTSASYSNASTNTTLLNNTASTVFATTSSNNFTGTQYISNTNDAVGFSNTTSSIYTDGGFQVTKNAYFSSSMFIKGNLTVFGTQSVSFITSSQLNISTNVITVNTNTPSIRFGGLSVYDSGSTGATGSLFWDSQNDKWIYQNASGSTYSGGMLISGPRNTGSLGDEQGTTLNAIMKGQGGDHITSSAMFESGSGNIGIGTSVPAYKLDVQGTAGFSGIVGINGASEAGWALKSNGNLKVDSSSGTTVLQVNDTSNGGKTWSLISAGSGNVHSVATGSFYLRNSSDSITAFTISSSGSATFSNVVGIGGSFYSNVALTIKGTITGANDSWGVYQGDIILSPVTNNSAIGYQAGGTVATGASNTISKYTAYYTDVLSKTGTGTITNTYGLYISAQTVGTNNYSAYFSQNVGIGTTSPGSLLDINGTVSATRIILGNALFTNVAQTETGAGTLGSGYNFNLNNGSPVHQATGQMAGVWYNAGTIQWYTNSSQTSNTAAVERMRITNDGRVGIGTTNPVLNLDVVQNTTDIVRIRARNTNASGSAWIILNPEGAGAGSIGDAVIFYDVNNTAWVAGVDKSDSSKYKISNDPNGDFRTGNYFTIQTNGNVGIGTTSPDRALDVTGLSAFRQPNATNSTTLSILQTATGGNGFNDTGLVVQTNAGDGTTKIAHFYDYNSGSPISRMAILRSGYVGIGTTNPSYKFHTVSPNNDTTSFAAFAALNLSQQVEMWYGGIRMGGSNTHVDMNIASKGSVGVINFITNGSTRMQIDGSGNIGAPSGTNIYNASDLRLKRNISTINDGLNKIMELNPVKFNWIENYVVSEENKDMLGFIAQEIQEVIPEAIESFANGNTITVGETSIENPLRVNEKFIIPVLVKALQELKAQNDDLQSQINELKA